MSSIVKPILADCFWEINSNGSSSSDDSSDDENAFSVEKYDRHQMKATMGSKYYMINDIKCNAYNNSEIKIHLSLTDEYGNKVYKIIRGGIFFDVYVEAKSHHENISSMLNELTFFDNTPQYIDCKYTAMGYTSKPTPVWRLSLNKNKLQYICNFCRDTQRTMYINVELNDALPLVQKSLGIHVKIPDAYNSRGDDNRYISYHSLQKLNQHEMATKTSSSLYICRKLSIDIEVYTPPTWRLFPQADQPGCEVIIIACTSQTNEEAYETLVLYLDKQNRKVNIKSAGEKRKFKQFRNEQDLLAYFIDMITPYNTDLITGWNVRTFDLKYIYTRCECFYPHLLKKFKTWSLNNRDISFRDITRKGQTVTLVDCFGIIILDMFDYNKSNVKAKSYKLKDIAKTYLNKQKIDLEYNLISRYYANGNDSEFSKLLEYCSVDAEIVLDLMAVQKVWNNTVSMADICHVPINFVLNSGVMRRNVCMISQFINESTDYLLPYQHQRPFTEYEGGFVNEPIVGFHTDPVFVLDFNSLYPTTMMAFNVCTTTVVRISSDYDEHQVFQPTSLPELTYTSKNNTTVTKTPYMSNVGFVTASHRRGVMPRILENLLKTRKTIQGELKITTCPQKRKQLDAQQLTYKLCANAIYGLLGCSFAPLYSPDVAASVTGFGRFLSYIKRQLLLNYMSEDGTRGRIIYGDTDSVMVGLENKTIAETQQIAISYAERITKDIGIPPIKTEYEKIFCPFLIHKKKHYIGVMYTNNCDQHDKIENKGNEMVRSDNCTLTTTVMRQITDILFFFGKEIDEKIIETGKCLRKILEPWSNIYMAYEKREPIPIDQMSNVVKMGIFSKKLSKEEYKNKLPHVAVYERMKNHKQYTIGDRITFCIANTEFTDKIKPKNIVEMAYDVDEFLEKPELFLSIHYYMDACVRKPLFRLYETLDPRFKETLEDVILTSFPPLVVVCERPKKRQRMH